MKSHAVMLSVLAAVLAMGYLGCNPDPTKNITVVRAEDPVTEDVTPDDADAVDEPADEADVTTYAIIADESSIDWEGSKVTETHIGGFAEFEGIVTVPEGNLEKAQVDLTINVDSLYSDAGGLTETMKSDNFLNVVKYPTASFKSTAIAKGEKADEYLVTGDVTLNGVTKRLTFPATITVDGDTLKTESEFGINRLDWNMVYQGLTPDSIIRDNALIRYDVIAKAQ